jgi:hypothetical protein
MPRDTARCSSSRKSRARGESLLELLEALPPSVSPFVELAPLVSEEPASEHPILRGKTIAVLLEHEQQVLDMKEAIRWKSSTDSLIERLQRLPPCPWGSAPGAL